MNNCNKLLAVIIVASMMSGCASIIHGPTQGVDFGSQPAGAMIIIDGKEYGQTPKTIELRRKGRLKDELKPKKQYAVKIMMDGYMPYEIKVKREVDGWFFGNLLLGGVIGIIIDASNGAMYKLSPDQIIVPMGKVTVMDVKGDGSRLYIAVTLEPDPSWEKIGTLSKSE
jgi:hypothetical protein